MRPTAVHPLTLALALLLGGCADCGGPGVGGDGGTADGHDRIDAGGTADAGTAADGGADAGLDGGSGLDGVVGPDGRILFETRNADGEPVLGLVYLPAGTGPFPAVVVLHGSGGLVDEPADAADPNDPQWDLVGADLEVQFEAWAALLTAEGYVVALPASFFSRGLHDWNKDPHPTLTAENRLRFRALDLRATVDVLVDRPDVDASRLGLVGFSNGASVILLSMQSGVENVSALAGLPAYEPARDFDAAIAYYPGCGLQNFVSLSSADAYLPRVQTVIQHGELDPLMEWCPTRDDQAQVAGTNANLGEDRLLLEVFTGVGHGFDSSPDNVTEETARVDGRARTLQLLRAAIGG